MNSAGKAAIQARSLRSVEQQTDQRANLQTKADTYWQLLVHVYKQTTCYYVLPMGKLVKSKQEFFHNYQVLLLQQTIRNEQANDTCSLFHDQLTFS